MRRLTISFPIIFYNRIDKSLLQPAEIAHPPLDLVDFASDQLNLDFRGRDRRDGLETFLEARQLVGEALQVHLAVLGV